MMRNIARMSLIAETTDFLEPHWLSFLDANEWNALVEITQLTRENGVEALIGGALALAAYTPLRRRTKDIDFYVRPSDRPAFEQLLRKAGFKDLFEKDPYDRGWISRNYRSEVIVDIIWGFANYLTTVDDDWFRHGPFISCGDKNDIILQIVPPEELLWAKLFVFQRDRCDWPDLLNLLYYTHDRLNRERLMARLGQDAPLFNALEEIFHWLVPAPPEFDKKRADLLDGREWFLPALTHQLPPIQQRNLPA